MQWRNTTGRSSLSFRSRLNRADVGSRRTLLIVCIFLSLCAFGWCFGYLKQRSREQCLMSSVGIENTKHMLRTLVSAFDKHNVSYWIDYGTLLGSIREGRVLKWSWEDLDVSFFHYDLEKVHTLVRQELESEGRYSLRPSFKIKPNWSSAFVLFTNFYYDNDYDVVSEGENDESLPNRHVKRLSVEEQTRMYIDEEHSKVPACDLYAWKVLSDAEGGSRKLMKLGYVREKKEEHQVRDLDHFFRPLPLPRTCLLFGLNVSCPHHSLEYLRSLYGDDALLTAKPKKFWKCALHLHFFAALSSLASQVADASTSVFFVVPLVVLLLVATTSRSLRGQHLDASRRP